jgi:hypothetical protein
MWGRHQNFEDPINGTRVMRETKFEQ